MNASDEHEAAQGRPGAVVRWLPGLALLSRYDRSWLRLDVVTGLVLAALLVPQGMAYAELAGLPPVTGLYATLVPLLVYALVGPSRIMVVGPDSAVSPLVAAAVIPLAAAGEAGGDRVAIAGLVAVLVGAMMIAGGLLRFGLITELLSMPVRLGYLAGIAVTVIATQSPKLLGYSTRDEHVLGAVADLVRGLDRTHPWSLAIGGASLVLILVLRRVAPRVPGVGVAVLGATVASALIGLDAHGVAVVGDLPRGVPTPHLPSLDLDLISKVLPAAIGITFVAVTDTSVLSRSYAARLRHDVDQNQELVALGAVNLGAGLFQGFPLSTSSSRTAVAEDLGAKTQLAGVVGALALAVLLLFATGLLHALPVPTLAAVVIAAVLGLIDVAGLARLRRWRLSEFALALVAFGGVALVGVLWGIGIAVGLSLALVLRRSWRPHAAVLGRVDGLKGYHDVSRYPHARRIPGLVLYRFDAPLFFANAEHFRAEVLELAATPGVRWIVVAAEPMTDVDATAAEVLQDMEETLEARGIELAFAELKDPVRERLERYGLTGQVGHHRFYPTIGVAVDAYVDEAGVDWVDWEEAGGESVGPPTVA